tara:strand:+ start:176 stop:394 length:219 start_codon:yes stop_codon:yes gene_type:complete
MAKPKINPETWVGLYAELSDYILEYSSLDPIWETDSEGNEIAVRTEEKQDEFLDIVDNVETIMGMFLKKEQD